MHNNHKWPVSVYTHTLTIHFQGHTHTNTQCEQGTSQRKCLCLQTHSGGAVWHLTGHFHTHTHTYGPITAALAGPIKLFSKCCSADIACLVNPACYWQKCSSITQACVVALLWSHLDGDHSLCIGWLGLVICEEGLVMLCLLESGPQLSWLLRFRDFCFRGVFVRVAEHWHCKSTTWNCSIKKTLQLLHNSKVALCHHRKFAVAHHRV